MAPYVDAIVSQFFEVAALPFQVPSNYGSIDLDENIA